LVNTALLPFAFHDFADVGLVTVDPDIRVPQSVRRVFGASDGGAILKDNIDSSLIILSG
jgi:hypothetical protein